MSVPLTVSRVERFRRVGCIVIANLKTVSSRLIRKEFLDLAAKYFDNKPYFWTGAYFVASCGGVTIEQLKKYVENQKNSPKVETLPR